MFRNYALSAAVCLTVLACGTEVVPPAEEQPPSKEQARAALAALDREIGENTCSSGSASWTQKGDEKAFVFNACDSQGLVIDGTLDGVQSSVLHLSGNLAFSGTFKTTCHVSLVVDVPLRRVTGGFCGFSTSEL